MSLQKTKLLQVLDNFLKQDQIFDIYEKFLSTPKWYLTRGSNNVNSNYGFGGLIIENEHPDILGFLITNLVYRAKKIGISLSNKPIRCHAVVKQKNAPVEFHQDIDDRNCYSFIGLLTPEWKPEWGGEFETDNKKIIFEPGQFVLIPSTQLHCGYGPKVDIPYWRLIINIILKEE